MCSGAAHRILSPIDRLPPPAALFLTEDSTRKDLHRAVACQGNLRHCRTITQLYTPATVRALGVSFTLFVHLRERARQ